MKIKLVLFSVILGFIASACYDLTLQPKGMLGEPELYGTEFGVKKYFSGIYTWLPIEDFTYFARSGGSSGFSQKNNGWEAGKFSQGNMSGEFVNTWIKVNNDGFGYWPYDKIRLVNSFIANFPDYKTLYGDVNVYNSLMGEAHFLRAYFYFGLAKRYGGVPLITKVQDILGSKDSLNVKRATEYATWKLIHDDLQFAIANLRTTKEAGRANKYVAAALMSRAMLYAGTIAKYTDYLNFKADQKAAQLGLAGMDPSQAVEFFQYSYDAGKIVESGGYTLYTDNKIADPLLPVKASNFASLFQDPTSSENIFVKFFDKNTPGGLGLKHSYDALMSPNPDMASEVGAESYPSLDFMRMFDFPAFTDAAGKPIRFAKRSDITNGMEPRLRGTCYFDGDVLRGKTYSIQRGIYKSFPGLAADAQSGSSVADINKNGNRILGNKNDTDPSPGGDLITGQHGQFENGGGESNTLTGAYIRKYVNTNMATPDVRLNNSAQHYIVFRLGEIYLNQAEVCYELGRKAEAFDYIEKIRIRAGAIDARHDNNPTDPNSLTKNGYLVGGDLQFIRDERFRELFGENHRWWDLRRWRVVDAVVKQWIPRALECYYDRENKKYFFLDESVKNNETWTASKASNYEPIPQGEINKNTNLLPQNPLR